MNAGDKKTIFIVITRGFIVRNILRCGVLDLLKENKNFRIVIFLVGKKDKVPEYLLDEFRDDNVILEKLEDPKINRFRRKLHRIFLYYISFLVFTKSTKSYIKRINKKGEKKNKTTVKIKILFFSAFSKLKFLIPIARFLEKKLFTYDCYAGYFDKYKPDLVFSTSIISLADNIFMKEACRRGVKTVSMPKGWDNVTKKLYQFVPDKLILQNEVMKKGAIEIQKINENKIAVCGFPQFDWYRRKDLIWSRQEFFEKIGLNPDRKLLFFGSEGTWTPDDNNVVKDLASMLKEDNFIFPCSLYVRPHFSNIRENKYEIFRGIENIKVDDTIKISEFFSDNWDPGVEETLFLINAIYHSDVMITINSTLTLDACCFNKPITAIAYKVLFNKKNKDVSEDLYKTDHYSDVVETEAIDMVYNKKELLNSINNYLKNPNYKNEERNKLLNELCYKVDGESSFRFLQVVEDSLL